MDKKAFATFFFLLLLLLPPRQSGHMCFPAHLLLLLFLPSPTHIRGPFGCTGRNVRCPASRWVYVPHENRPAKHYGCAHACVEGWVFSARKKKRKKPKELSQIFPPDRERGSSLGRRVKRIRGIEKVGCPNFRKGGKCLLGFARTPIPTSSSPLPVFITLIILRVHPNIVWAMCDFSFPSPRIFCRPCPSTRWPSLPSSAAMPAKPGK